MNFKNYSLGGILLLFCSLTFSQKLLWSSETGGTNQNGAIISYDLQTQQTETIASLGGNFMQSYYLGFDANLLNDVYFNSGGMTVGQDGYIYAVNEFANNDGVRFYRGVFYRIDPSDWSIKLLHTFSSCNDAGPYVNNSVDGASYSSFGNELSAPGLGIIEAKPGVFYGIAIHGGKYGHGGVWKYEVNNSQYSMVVSYDTLATGGIGRNPRSPLITGPNGDLYGVAKYHGVYPAGNQDGHLYKIDINTEQGSIVANLDAAGWAISDPKHQIVYNPSENKIFGTKERDAGINSGGGVYSYDFTSGIVTNETYISYGEVDILGEYANGMTPRAADGGHYFLCRSGGANNKGTIVKYNPSGNTMVAVHSFQGNQPNNTTHVDGTKIYGTYNALYAGQRMFWSYDVASGIFHDFLIGTNDNSPGYQCSEAFVLLNGELIGSANWGGKGDAGSIFRYNLSNSTTTPILERHSEQGRSIRGEIMLEENNLLRAYTPAGGTAVGNTEYSEHGGLLDINLITGDISFNKYTQHIDYQHTNQNFYLGYTKTSNGDLYIPIHYSNFNGTALIIERYSPVSDNREQVFTSEASLINSKALEYKPNHLVIANYDTLIVLDEANDNSQGYHTNYSFNELGVLVNKLIMGSNGKVYGTTMAHDDYIDPNNKCVIYSLDTTTWAITIEHTFTHPVKELNIGLTEVNGVLYGNTLSGGANGDGF
ncbi:hypothetical protein OAH12_00825, partial [Cyclobacteriaceae bacterium]|nr:hypothetical protein [Cyclobacteriaceae bacterium]